MGRFHGIHELSVAFVVCARCLCVNIQKSQRVVSQFPSFSMSINNAFAKHFLNFLFVILVVTTQEYTHKTQKDLSDFGCTLPWVKINDSCYCNGPAGTWQEGRDFCFDKSGYLVEIGSKQEQMSLSGYFQHFDTQLNTWIGLKIKGMEWLWDFSNLSIYNNYTNWANNEPSNWPIMEPSTKNCTLVSFNARFESGKWWTFRCNGNYNPICEKPLSLSTPTQTTATSTSQSCKKKFREENHKFTGQENNAKNIDMEIT